MTSTADVVYAERKRQLSVFFGRPAECFDKMSSTQCGRVVNVILNERMQFRNFLKEGDYTVAAWMRTPNFGATSCRLLCEALGVPFSYDSKLRLVDEDNQPIDYEGRHDRIRRVLEDYRNHRGNAEAALNKITSIVYEGK